MQTAQAHTAAPKWKFTEGSLMRHWRAVDAILIAAGETPALFGEIRHVKNEPPMQAAYEIWDGRR